MEYDLILHIDCSDENIFRLVCRNANNYLNALPNEKFELHIVANGAAVTLFTGAHPQLRELAEPLLTRGARFKICANALKDNNIDPVQLWPGCLIVPAGLVEIVRLQRAGFAYIKP